MKSHLLASVLILMLAVGCTASKLTQTQLDRYQPTQTQPMEKPGVAATRTLANSAKLSPVTPMAQSSGRIMLRSDTFAFEISYPPGFTYQIDEQGNGTVLRLGIIDPQGNTYIGVEALKGTNAASRTNVC